MYLQVIKTKKSVILNIAKSFRKAGGGTSSTIVERLGNLEEIREREGCADPMAWARERLAELNRAEKEQKRAVTMTLSPTALIPLGKARTKCAGDLILHSSNPLSNTA